MMKDCECIICGRYLPDSAPKEVYRDLFVCGECAFIEGGITDKEYIEKYLYWIALDGVRAAVHAGKIYVTAFDKRFSFELSTQDHRHTEEYRNWRTEVFNRDDFKCQICNQVGGTLNAHHIKEFAKNPELRFDVDNGITLCESCHKKIHKRKGMKWPAETTK